MTDNRKIARLRGEINQLDDERRQQETVAQGGGMLVTLSSAGVLVGLLLLMISGLWWLGALVLLGSAGLFAYQWYRRRQAVKRIAEINAQVERFEQEIAAEIGLASADQP